MLSILTEWLSMRANHAPVTVRFHDSENSSERIMLRVDATGVVLARRENISGWSAYPWREIAAISPVLN
ncbi:hypothetical protein [Novosphingobium sp. ST904]|uniref:hypothetical protein n=1 Tax=Novosphingobium sp. ST904 TaxID=1684385 RepID=UPI0012E175F4|nr:hypothetical protein [Novosphingobium sp. ST904]